GLFLVSEFRGNPMTSIAAEAAKGLRGLRETVDITNPNQLFAAGQRIDGWPAVSFGDAAQIQYTSGTTGFPKGAVLSHSGLINNARLFGARCEVDADSTWINMMPMFHTTGCAMITLCSLLFGSRMVLVSLYDPTVVVRLIESQRADMVLGVPTMILALLEVQEETPRDVSSLALIICGGATVAPELVRRVHKTFGCEFATVYGQTEHCPLVTQPHRSDSIDDICSTAGQPVAQTEVSIRSTAENAVVPVGMVGEICARGPSVMIGYNDNPEATAAAIDGQGWLHTGDLGVMDSRGYLAVTGRVKDMIIRGGENMFPAEIENVLLEDPSVTEVAVVGLPDPKWGEVVAAFVRCPDNLTLDKEILHNHCRSHISPQKTPVVWCQVTEFPLTGSGKIQKFELREGFLDGTYEAL
ncbi:MAG: AMP-binding protein, partial [Rhodobacteraceae bacterium]|nr:AMP-binding protein [Paracoccaceae bacterium]